jgi:uncharacterized surface protein with fasciclin (FAS1) repeats
MNKILSRTIFSFVLLISTGQLFAQQKDVVDIAIGSPAHTTLVAAVKAADLVSVLKGKGPFTVFAPTNDAFAKLPDGTVTTLLKPENKAKLAAILTYHVVAGNLTAADVVAAVKKGNGKAVVTTVNGGKLTITLDGEKVKLTDENGNASYVTAADLKGSNGVVHVVDTVVLPK